MLGDRLKLSAAVLALEDCLGLGRGVAILSFLTRLKSIPSKSNKVRGRLTGRDKGVRVKARGS